MTNEELIAKWQRQAETWDREDLYVINGEGYRNAAAECRALIKLAKAGLEAEKLREALRPFARCGVPWLDSPLSGANTLCTRSTPDEEMTVTIDDFRRAARALS